MDRATTTAIKKVTARVDSLDGEFRGGIAALREEMRTGFDSVQANFESVRAEIVDNRRHAQVLFESLQDDIRIIAEGLAHMSAKIDRIRP